MHPSFWGSFIKRANAGTTGYIESSDDKLNTFFNPNKDAVSSTMVWGVKFDMSPDESDMANGMPFSHSPSSERFSGRAS